MNARFYVPNTNRMVSPDTIVPDAKDPQSFNRYSYALNNPVKYTDPSGHCVYVPPFDTAVCIALLALTLTGDSEQPPVPDNYPNHTTLSLGCTDTLADCFQARSLRQFEDYEQIDQEEFNNLLDTVAEDLYAHDIPTNLGGQWVAGRGAYDTPFYNGEGRGGLPPGEGYDSNQQICLDQGCFGRSEVNYIAQGMWAAAGGYSLDDALDQTEAWNELSYGQDASPGKLYWTEYGYNWYIEWIQQQEE